LKSRNKYLYYQIVKFGGDITDEEVEEIYDEIIEWWNDKG
jgi:hypothetical protein